MADEALRMPIPIQRNPEYHIAFLERQRNLDDGAVLRIQDHETQMLESLQSPCMRMILRPGSCLTERLHSIQDEPASSGTYSMMLIVLSNMLGIEISQLQYPTVLRLVSVWKGMYEIPWGLSDFGSREFNRDITLTRTVLNFPLHAQEHPQFKVSELAIVQKERDQEIPYLSWNLQLGAKLRVCRSHRTTKRRTGRNRVSVFEIISIDSDLILLGI